MEKFIIIILLIPNLALASIESDINQYRKEQGLYTLKVDKRLVQSSQYKVNDMIYHHYFAHTNHFGDSVHNLIDKRFKKWLFCGEILAKNYKPSEVVDKWIKSTTHKAIITDDFNYMGCYNKDNLTACHFIKI